MSRDKDEGGDAFPSSRQRGMTLRDYFAAKAMQALINHPHKEPENFGPKAVPKLAGFAYEYADAMLAARVRS